MKRITVAILVLLLILSGCKAKKQEASSGEAIGFELVGEPVEKGKNVYVVLKVLTNQYWQGVVAGLSEAAKDNKCNVYVGACVDEGDWQAQQKLLDEAMEKKADGIIVAPANSTLLSDKLKEIKDSGIPVVLVDTIMNDVSSFDTCYMTDNLSAGSKAAEEMMRLFEENGISKDEKAEIAIQITSTASQTVIDRMAGFNQYWSANAPENWKVLDDIGLNNGNKEKAQQLGLEFAENHKDLKGMFGCNNSSTVGFVKGLEESGRDDIMLVGFDYADETAALIKKDNKTATIVQNQKLMGYKGVERVLELLEGGKSDLKFTDTGAVPVNHSNYAEYEKELEG